MYKHIVRAHRDFYKSRWVREASTSAESVLGTSCSAIDHLYHGMDFATISAHLDWAQIHLDALIAEPDAYADPKTHQHEVVIATAIRDKAKAMSMAIRDAVIDRCKVEVEGVTHKRKVV